MAEQILSVIAFVLLLAGLVTVTNAISEAAVTFALAVQRRLRRRRELRMLAAYEAELLPAAEQLRDEAS